MTLGAAAAAQVDWSCGTRDADPDGPLTLCTFSWTATLATEGPLTVVPLPLVSLPVNRDCFVLPRAPSAVASALTDLVRDCNGVVAVEFLIMLGPLLLLLLGTFDLA
jgi:hypothetical protein